MTDPLRVLHLTGSPTSAFWAALSETYARRCLELTADPDRYAVTVAHVAPDGAWRLDDGPAVALADALPRLADAEVMVPHLFCPAGLTDYRALFDVLGVPYVGNRPQTMALSLHKARTRAVVAAAGVAVPAGEVVTDEASLTPPVVVKPVDGDNSAGVTLVRDAADLPAAIAAALAEGSAALVETYVPAGREVRCGLIEHRGELLALPLEEYALDAEAKPIRDAADKLAPDGDGLRLVAKDERAWIVADDDPIVPDVQAAARRCHLALGCRHHSLFDFRIDPENRPWFLEAGPYCSFSDQSVVATMAAAAGIGLRELFAGALATALEAPT